MKEVLKKKNDNKIDVYVILIRNGIWQIRTSGVKHLNMTRQFNIRRAILNNQSLKSMEPFA